MEIRTFDDAIAYMNTYMNLERKTRDYSARTYRLDRMRQLLTRLGNPERKYRTIHVAGSKGKGSTARFIAQALDEKGYRTGLYMSPHLTDYRERFTMCGKFFPDELLVGTAVKLQKELEDFQFVDELGPSMVTTFELYTAYAYMLFAESECEWAVIETGLGGRLDATNTLDPEAAVIVPIELEHTTILGDTLEKIATEKSKIIMKTRPVFVAPQENEALTVFRNEASVQNSQMFYLPDHIRRMDTFTTTEGQSVDIDWIDGTHDHLMLQMRGKIQAMNAALALLVLKKLGLKDEKTDRGLEKAYLPGRFDYLAEDLIIDAAHTRNSMKALFESIGQLYDRKNLIVIFGAILDKDYSHMCQIILDSCDKVIVSKPGSFKPSDIASIYDCFMKHKNDSQDIYLIEDNDEALRKAYELKNENSVILVCGSFYLGGCMKKAWGRLNEPEL